MSFDKTRRADLTSALEIATDLLYCDLAQLQLCEVVEYGNSILVRCSTDRYVQTTYCCIGRDGEEFYPISDSLKGLDRFLRDAWSEISPAAIACVLDWCVPKWLDVLPSKLEYTNRHTGHREGPKCHDTSLKFFCNNERMGVVIEVTFRPEFGLKVEVVGEGLKGY
ncbi:MAG: hypothetical protein AAF483_27650 [Planctomycetota bacterium]